MNRERLLLCCSCAPVQHSTVESRTKRCDDEHEQHFAGQFRTSTLPPTLPDQSRGCGRIQAGLVQGVVRQHLQVYASAHLGEAWTQLAHGRCGARIADRVAARHTTTIRAHPASSSRAHESLPTGAWLNISVMFNCGLNYFRHFSSFLPLKIVFMNSFSQSSAHVKIMHIDAKC